MLDCHRIDSVVTPFVDDILESRERLAVRQHLRECAQCRSRIAAEREVRRLFQLRRAALMPQCVPPGFRERLTAALVPETVAEVSTWRTRLVPLALAASLMVIVGTAFLYEATRFSSRLMVAELAADHVKCFMLNSVLGTHHTHDAVEAAMASGFEWRATLPSNPQAADLQLVGSRPCLYGQGRVAHIMYSHNGRPVSVFMLPGTVRAEEYVSVLGHEAAIWSEGERTFVLVAGEGHDEVQRMATFVHNSLK